MSQEQQRLEEKIAELQECWDLLSKKLRGLNKNKILESRSQERLRLESEIKDVENERNQVEEQLKEMESQLAEVNGDVKEISRNADQSNQNDGQGQHCFYIDLPTTCEREHFIGRKQYLEVLNRVWSDTKIKILVIEGIGGVGKSALVNQWLHTEILSNKEHKGAKSIFAYRFHSGTIGDTEGYGSSEPFIEKALLWFGENSNSGSSGEKVHRLVKSVKKNRTLLILDSLEPLQSPPGPGNDAYLKDPAMQDLLKALASDDRGLCLCIITTRAKVIELENFLNSTVEERELENLSPQSGVELLKTLGVHGSNDELEKAVIDFGSHALTLTLLGNFLKSACNGYAHRYSEIKWDKVDEKEGHQGRRVMKAYERWLNNKPLELAILQLLGFFLQKVDMKALEKLKKPLIPKLTDTVSIEKPDWNKAIFELRKMGLISGEDKKIPGVLDTHLFVRQYFATRVRDDYPSAWREGHKLLYKHYSNIAKLYPNPIEGMLDLFKAVDHGCKAGSYEEVLEQIYQNQIMNGDKYFSTNKLGAIGSELTALSGFFDKLWTVPVSSLSEESKGYVLKEAGFHLLALGRPEEAVEPTEQALKIWEKRGDQHHAVRAASKLSELYLTLGHLDEALNYATENVKLANRIDHDKITFQQMAKANLAAVLHQLGDFSKAKNLFQEVANMQKEREPEYPLLYSWQGFRYCDLLLDRDESEQSLEIFQEVQQHANQILGWVEKKGWLFDIALNSLVLGRILLLIGLKTPNIDENIGNSNLKEAETHLDEAVKNLRNSYRLDYLPYSLIIRSILYRETGYLDNSKNDLDEALRLAESGRMKIYQADAHLEFAHFYITKSEFDNARTSLEKAEALIREMNYHRQDWRVKDLEKILPKN